MYMCVYQYMVAVFLFFNTGSQGIALKAENNTGSNNFIFLFENEPFDRNLNCDINEKS